jgi:hypothetical protein
MSFDTLRQRVFLVGQSSIEDAENAVKRYGYSEGDFTVSVVDDTQWQGELVPIKSLINFRYNPTGIERNYKAGMDSTWPAEFEMDLRGGVFKGQTSVGVRVINELS